MTPVASFADEVTITLTPEIAYVDTVVNVDTTTAYVITTTTGPRTEVVDSVTVERVAWVDSWLILYRGGVADTRTVIAQDDDSNSTTNNFWASRLSGTLTPDTYTIRATSFEYVTSNQRPIGTYTLSSNLINLPDTNTATVDTNTAVIVTPPVIDIPTVVVQPIVTQPIINVPAPIGIIELPTLDQSPPTEISLPIEEPLVIEPVLGEPTFVDPQDNSIPIQQEIDNPVLENPSIEPFTTPELFENISQDLNITPAEASALVSILMSDGIVSNLEATNLIEALSVGGELTRIEENLIIQAINADGNVTTSEVNNLSEALSQDGRFTEAERELVAEALILEADGGAVKAEDIKAAGVTFEDLPPSTPVELRQDINGNEVIVVAEIAAALVILESPVELLTTIFSDPAQALLAISSIGADMSDEERSESEQTIVSAVIVTGIAVQSATTAALAGGVGYRRRL